MVATAAYEAVERVGLPEAGLILAHATVYLATAPKSPSAAKAVWQAQAAIEAGAGLEVPLHLRNASFSGAQQLGYGQEYEYSHDFPSDDPRRYQQRYLPEGVSGPFYQPSHDGAEATIRERLAQIRRWRPSPSPRGKRAAVEGRRRCRVRAPAPQGTLFPSPVRQHGGGGGSSQGWFFQAMRKPPLRPLSFPHPQPICPP